MDWKSIYKSAKLNAKADALFAGQKRRKRLDGWFRVMEIMMKHGGSVAALHPEIRAAKLLNHVVSELPLSIDESAVFAGTQNDAFARSYALINPAFKVETFEGYCDPLAVFKDIEPNGEFSRERINRVRSYFTRTPFVNELKKVYAQNKGATWEVVYFVEQVTGHTVADFRPILARGISGVRKELEARAKKAGNESKPVYDGMRIALEAPLVLARRYSALAESMAGKASGARKNELLLIARTLQKVPLYPAENLFEALQSYLLLWQVMCLEQAPNPFAFSAGNVDRIFEPYRAKEKCPVEMAAGLFRHFLVFFNVGDRSWAISQNMMISGRDVAGRDLTNKSSYAFCEAFFAGNHPQPNFSVKVHKNTPARLYRELGRFFFTPGHLTPSLFNDDSMFAVLAKAGRARADLPDYSIAGCQEPLIMGKDSGNTTNSWLNLAKVLELALNDGRSSITGKKIGLSLKELGGAGKDPAKVLANARSAFYRQLEYFTARMADQANGCSRALSRLPVPFLSTAMGGIASGIDMRDKDRQGTKYNASGCLIHGLSVVADSFVAIDSLLNERPHDAGKLLAALRDNFKNAGDLRQYLAICPKYGNNIKTADDEAVAVAGRVAGMVAGLKNYLGNPFQPDFSTPSTHLLYGYWVGATPDGRKAREMLGYGIDPHAGDAHSGLWFRTLSARKLPFEKMTGGYASHYGIDARYFPEKSLADKGAAFARRVIKPLFFSLPGIAPFYLYVNVSTPDTLRAVLANPPKYAPNGIYIVRIHGTFVNFLELAPAIQEDIIARLDPASTAISA